MASNPRSGFNPKTGVARNSPSRTMRPKAPVLSDSAHTSSDAQKLVRRPPAPFDNPNSALNVPAPTNPQFRSNGNPRELVDKPRRVGVANTSLSADEMAAIGYSPTATRSDNPIISGFRTRVARRRK
jgi:hypothetical protein